MYVYFYKCFQFLDLSSKKVGYVCKKYRVEESLTSKSKKGFQLNQKLAFLIVEK